MDPLTLLYLLSIMLRTLFLFLLPILSLFYCLAWINPIADNRPHFKKGCFFPLSPLQLEGPHPGDLRLFWRLRFSKYCVLQFLCLARHVTKYYLGLERGSTFLSFFLFLDTMNESSFYEGLVMLCHFNTHVCKYYFIASSYFFFIGTMT